ncbi:MAG: glycoside hydrolase family 3 C-terminal domain-containing protein [Chitinophagaceae bacterium]|nr:glycoside hydrolase family 3 C-terminal domain-containing protein [Chitinophagaceae bacterium]
MKPNSIFFLLLFFVLGSTAQSPAYLNASLPLETRVQDLLGRMTLAEKASQVNNTSPAIQRLKIPAYNWWNEALHGVARAGLATSFPQPIGLAATFNDKAIFTMGEIISDEARAKYNRFQREGKHGLYEGLTFYSPNINIFRDPRWGRGHETFGEDPYLTGTMGVAFVKAMQGDDPAYFKTICTAKHYAVHSGPEPVRHEFNAEPSKRDLWETYLPAFKMLAQEGKVYSFMCAYNRLYGEPCCSDPFLLTEILRKQWGFNGFVATDCGAVYDMFISHHTAKDSVDGMAKAIRAGVDNHCMGYVGAVIPAIELGLLKEWELDTAVARLLRARFKLGMFDDTSLNRYSSIPYNVVNNKAHREYALELAKQSIVLLKNRNSILPLSKKVKTIAVIGPNANDAEVSLGNYNGEPEHIITVLEGIKNVLGKNVQVKYQKGCYITDTMYYNREADFKPAIEAAAAADVIVFVGGISPRLEGEALQVKVDGFDGGDKTNLDLPAVQTALLKELKKTGKPIVLVLMNGSALSINWENENMDAIIEAWYGGEAAGQAIAEVLFGDHNPAGRLPVSFYRSINDIPAFDDYAMKGKTYRYCEKPVLYPFGYGLSYTKFAYSDLKLSSAVLSEKIEIMFTVKNTGKMEGDEVVQLYIHQQGQQAIKELKGYHRVHLKKGASKQITFALKPGDLLHYSAAKDGLAILPGKVELMIGASSQDIKLRSAFLIKNN